MFNSTTPPAAPDLYASTSVWQNWSAYFSENAHHKYRYHFSPFIPDRRWQALATTLERFRQSETGEGRVIKEIQKAKLPFLDEHYYQSLKLFVAEEGRHARVIGGMLRACGLSLSDTSAGVSVFRFVRGIFGPCFKLSILLAAEINACVFYHILTRHIKEHEIHYSLCRIIRDESEHLNFHLDFFRKFKNYSPVRFYLYTRMIRYVIAPAAFFGVWFTNIRTWRILKVSFLESYKLYRIRKHTTLYSLT